MAALSSQYCELTRQAVFEYHFSMSSSIQANWSGFDKFVYFCFASLASTLSPGNISDACFGNSKYTVVRRDLWYSQTLARSHVNSYDGDG